MTRIELQTTTLRLLNESPTAPAYWSFAEIQAYIAEGQEVVAEEAPAFKRQFVIPRRPGTIDYQIPGVGQDIITPYRIWLPDLKRNLEVKHLVDLDSFNEYWLNTVGEPWWWIPISWDQYLVWPPPTTSDGTMEVDCYVWPAPLVDNGDSPEFHPSQHQALTVYGEWLGHLKEWDAPKALKSLQTFLATDGNIRSQEGVRQIQEKFFGRERAGRGDYFQHR